MTATPSNSSPRLTSLDVLGVGLSIEMFRQSQAWFEMQEHPKESILPSNAAAYSKEHEAKASLTARRSADSLESSVKLFVENWPIPCLSVWPHLHVPASSESTGYFRAQVDNLRNAAGMPDHQFAPYSPYFKDSPEDILERVFQFFEGHPSVPVLLVTACDGDMIREKTGDTSREMHWKDGPRRVDGMAESMVALMLARRERVNAMRSLIGSPEVWTREQFQQFDRLPTVGQLHRPIRVDYRQDRGSEPSVGTERKGALMSARKREESFKAGFELALQAISDGTPARVFYDTAGPVNGARVIPLAQSLSACLPDFELFSPETGYDISARIGNTGAASPFVQWALSIISGFHDKGASVAVNLRQKEEATITVVTPCADRRPYTVVDPIDFYRTPGKLKYVQPSSAPTSVAAVHTQKSLPAALLYATPIGTRCLSGDECPQSGMWKCEPPDAEAGATHYIPIGRVLPAVRAGRDLTTLQKLRGESPQVRVDTTWTLVSYSVPAI